MFDSSTALEIPSNGAVSRPLFPYHERLAAFFADLREKFGEDFAVAEIFTGQNNEWQAAIRHIKTRRVWLLDVAGDGQIISR